MANGSMANGWQEKRTFVEDKRPSGRSLLCAEENFTLIIFPGSLFMANNYSPTCLEDRVEKTSCCRWKGASATPRVVCELWGSFAKRPVLLRELLGEGSGDLLLSEQSPGLAAGAVARAARRGGLLVWGAWPCCKGAHERPRSPPPLAGSSLLYRICPHSALGPGVGASSRSCSSLPGSPSLESWPAGLELLPHVDFSPWALGTFPAGEPQGVVEGSLRRPLEYMIPPSKGRGDFYQEHHSFSFLCFK